MAGTGGGRGGSQAAQLRRQAVPDLRPVGGVPAGRVPVLAVYQENSGLSSGRRGVRVPAQHDRVGLQGQPEDLVDDLAVEPEAELPEPAGLGLEAAAPEPAVLGGGGAELVRLDGAGLHLEALMEDHALVAGLVE